MGYLVSPRWAIWYRHDGLSGIATMDTLREYVFLPVCKHKLWETLREMLSGYFQMFFL